MKKLYCIICEEYIKFEKAKIRYLLEKTIFLCVICSKYKNEDEKLFSKEVKYS